MLNMALYKALNQLPPAVSAIDACPLEEKQTGSNLAVNSILPQAFNRERNASGPTEHVDQHPSPYILPIAAAKYFPHPGYDAD
jgi:hypothetical protein